MDVLVPFAADRPKTRLADTLDSEERRAFAAAMLSDVLEAVEAAGHEPQVLATSGVDCTAPVTVDERDLTTAVNDALPSTDAADRDPPVGVVMSDLALATPRALKRFLAADGDLVIVPGRGGGTNALVVRHPEFRVDYHGASFRDHLRIARDIDATVRTFDSHRLSTDVDERADLAELLVHGEGEAKDWLVDTGFELDVDTGRVGVERDEASDRD